MGPRQNVVWLDIVDDAGEGAQLVVAVCDFPAAAAVLCFRGTAALVLWHERRMVDKAAAATDYQRRRRGRALAESFVVMAEGIGFGEGSSGVDIE